MATQAVKITIINGTNQDLSFTNFWCSKDDWESPPKFPERVAPSSRQEIRAEAMYYRKTVPFSVSVGCNGETFDIDKYDPYHGSWTVTTKDTNDLTVTMVVGPLGQAYDLMILVTGTKYSV